MVGLCFAFLFGGVASRGIPVSPNGARRRYVYGVGSLEIMNIIHPKHRGSRTLRSGSRRHRRRGHPRCGGALRRWPMRFCAPARAVLSLLMTMPVYSTAGVVPAADPTREEGHVRSLQSRPCRRHCPWEQEPWSTKCDWVGCSGCSECSTTLPSPIPPLLLPPSSSPVCRQTCIMALKFSWSTKCEWPDCSKLFNAPDFVLRQIS